MARIVLILLAAVLFMGCQSNTDTPTHEQSLSPEQVNEKIASLEKFIIPPKGTNKADVDTVFGQPEEIKELKGKGTPVAYPMHAYTLLPPKKGQDFRAILCVTYRQGKVYYIGINHLCVAKGKPAYYEIFKEEIIRENRLKLADLLEIKNKYDSKLKTASWNRQACE